MPVGTVHHRAAVGSFVTIFINFMTKRARKAASNFYRTLRIPVSVRPTDFVLLFLLGQLLSRCGDIEPNPGPDRRYGPLGSQREHGTGASELQRVLYTVNQIHQQNVTLERQVSANHYDTAQSMNEIKKQRDLAVRNCAKKLL